MLPIKLKSCLPLSTTFALFGIHKHFNHHMIHRTHFNQQILLYYKLTENLKRREKPSFILHYSLKFLFCSSEISLEHEKDDIVLKFPLSIHKISILESITF